MCAWNNCRGVIFSCWNNGRAISCCFDRRVKRTFSYSFSKCCNNKEKDSRLKWQLATFIKMDAREIDRLKKTAFATVSKKGKVK